MFHVNRKVIPYTGQPLCMAGIPWEFQSKDKAIESAQKFEDQTQEQWNVYNSETGEIVYGT